MKIALISPTSPVQGRLFGAERLIRGLHDALSKRCEVDWIEVPVSEATWDGVLESYLGCYDLDLSKYDAVVSTKNPTFMARHPNHICWLIHQIRVFYDRFDDEYGHCEPVTLAEHSSRRDLIRKLDTLGFRGARKVFTIGHEVSRRLKQYNGFESEALHPPLENRGYFCGGQDYFFLPGRLHRWKRVDLAIRAFKLTRCRLPLLIAGTGEDESCFKELAKDDPRIKFLGYVSDDEMIELYAHALGVLFVPKDEDFGYVTLEAMMSHKPVVTCLDSGEPTAFVRDKDNGFVAKPEPADVAAAIERLAASPSLAAQLGENGFRNLPYISWDDTAQCLLDACRTDSVSRATPITQIPKYPPRSSPSAIRQDAGRLVDVLVTDMQPLVPTVGGGRVRLRKICEGIARHFWTLYIGAFDWPGPANTDEFLLPQLRTRVFSLARLHYRLAARLQRLAPGGSVIDVSFPMLGRFSRGYVSALRQAARSSEVIVFSHPWSLPLIKKEIHNKLCIYESQNFEWGLRSQLLSSTWVGRILSRYVGRVEGKLVRRSRAIFACSTEDAKAMSKSYGVPMNRFFLVPNCADVEAIQPASERQRWEAKRSLEWEGWPVVLFVGSGYRPNTEAAAYIIEELASIFPDTLFVIAGSVKEDYLRTRSALELASRFSPPKLPCCFASGWYEPEEWDAGTFGRWTKPAFSVSVLAQGSRKITLRFRSPRKNRLTISHEAKRLGHPVAVHEGENSVEFEVSGPGDYQLQLKKDYLSEKDPRQLGCAVSSVSWQDEQGSSTALDLRGSEAEDLLPQNVKLLGVITDEHLQAVLKASDVALNPIEFGSGTNLKMLQYMAAGLPILSTAAGIRGIERADSFCFVSHKANFPERLRKLLTDASLRARLSGAAREVVLNKYDWRIAGARAASVIQQKLKYVRAMDPPFFSVIVPTYERPGALCRVIEALNRQTFPDFEVIVVDQSASPKPLPQSLTKKLRIKVICSLERGPARARNRGIEQARSLFLAFTDDDCIPADNWLERAAEHLDHRELAGLEGRVCTNKLGDPRYRTVSNVGFEAIGFMTANLFLRRELVRKAGGFDERFDAAFREDTDLGWRILQSGEIPHAEDVVVFHPPHRVKLQRESPGERAKMFVYDPLLFSKHPRRYMDLLFCEGHYKRTPGYWTYFLEGIKRHEVEPPTDRLLDELQKHDFGWWQQVSTSIRGNQGNGDEAMAESDLAALKMLIETCKSERRQL